MILEDKLFSIYYNECDSEYISDLINTIKSNLGRIMDFFMIGSFRQKKIIKIWNNLNDYIVHLESYIEEYYYWMVADTYDNNINILSYDLYLSAHEDGNMSDYQGIIVHELVHACQQELNPDAKNVVWFWEALAVNLSNQRFHLIDVRYSTEDIIHNYHLLRDSYPVSYTLGRYLLENYPVSQLLEYVKYPEKLVQDTEYILEKAKAWVVIILHC